MTTACIEHVNITVRDPDKLARLLCELFDWRVRWSGPAKNGGYTVHVGTEQRYMALYTHDRVTANRGNQLGQVNHIGLKVNDLATAEKIINSAGISTFSHSDYGACNSFYFDADETLEVEVVQYKTDALPT